MLEVSLSTSMLACAGYWEFLDFGMPALRHESVSEILSTCSAALGQ